MDCIICGRDNDNGTHTALEQAGHLSHFFTPPQVGEILAAGLARMSQIIDDWPTNRAMTTMERLLLRTVIKVREEQGEVAAALIGVTGQNPRKGVTHTVDDIENEMLDVAATALGGIEHLHNNDGSSVRRLANHVDRIRERLEPKVDAQ